MLERKLENWSWTGFEETQSELNCLLFCSCLKALHDQLILQNDDPLEVENPLEVECRY